MSLHVPIFIVFVVLEGVISVEYGVFVQGSTYVVSCLLSRGKEIRMVNIVERIKASYIKIVRLVLEGG